MLSPHAGHHTSHRTTQTTTLSHSERPQSASFPQTHTEVCLRETVQMNSFGACTDEFTCTCPDLSEQQHRICTWHQRASFLHLLWLALQPLLTISHVPLYLGEVQRIAPSEVSMPVAVSSDHAIKHNRMVDSMLRLVGTTTTAATPTPNTRSPFNAQHTATGMQGQLHVRACVQCCTCGVGLYRRLYVHMDHTGMHAVTAAS